MPNGKDKAPPPRATLSERDSLRVIALLENPPPANDRLARAARAGFVLPLAVAANAISAESKPDFMCLTSATKYRCKINGLSAFRKS